MCLLKIILTAYIMYLKPNQQTFFHFIFLLNFLKLANKHTNKCGTNWSAFLHTLLSCVMSMCKNFFRMKTTNFLFFFVFVQQQKNRIVLSKNVCVFAIHISFIIFLVFLFCYLKNEMFYFFPRSRKNFEIFQNLKL